MPILKRIHAASPGNKQSRTGAKLTLSNYDLDELALSYSPELHQCKVAVDDVQTAIQLGAPAVLGHLDPKLVQAKGAMPAFGRILSASTDNRGLWLDVELTEQMADWMQQGLYDHVSLSWYDRNDSRNPTPGQLHLRHLGVLGSEPSAMKDLQLPDLDLMEFSEGADANGCGVYQIVELTQFGIEFAEASMENEELVTPSEQEAVAVEPTEAEAPAEEESAVDPVQMLIEVLTSGGKGYKGEITGFLPEPSEDNSYLWDADKQQFAGQFLDFSGNEEETYDFTLTLQPDGSMIRSYRKVQDDEAEPVTDETVEAEADVADEPDTVEMSEGMIDQMQPVAMPNTQTVTVPMSEYEALQAKAVLYSEMLEAEAERMRNDRMNQLVMALEPLYSAGLLDYAVSPHDVAHALMSMSDAACCDYSLEFSEGETHTSPQETVLAVLKQIGAKAKVLTDTDIEFGEMAIDKEYEAGEAPGAKSPAGFVPNAKQAALDKKARKYCTDNGLDPKDSKSYMKAVKAVSAA